jgi:hypothetical protein
MSVARSPRLTSTLLLAAALSPLAAQADAQSLARCRIIADAAARLACYDAIAGPATAPSAVAVPAPEPVPVPGPVKAAAPAAPVTAAAPSDFGLESRAAAEQSIELRSHVRGRFEGWQQRTRIPLVNGQVWEVTESSRAAYWLDSPAVRVTRHAFGGFVMEVEGVARVLRVRRLE